MDLRLRNDLSDLSDLLDRVEAEAEAACLPQSMVRRLCLCLDEALTNIITHGYPQGAEGEIGVRLVLADGEATADIEDAGAPFNPLEAPPPDFLESEVSDRPIGGLGIHLIRNLSDHQAYAHQAGRNRLSLAFRPRDDDPPVGAGAP